MPTSLSQIAAYLDRYLRIFEIPDFPNALNGLQVENSGTVSHLTAAVDACQASIDHAAASPSTLLLVHHGLFWPGLEPLTGRHGRRVRGLMDHDTALYAAHLPLDCHPEVGNNAVLARSLGIGIGGWFGEFEGIEIGIWGDHDEPVGDLVQRLGRTLGVTPQLIHGGPDRTSRVGILTGGGGSMVREALQSGVDTFVTGEGAHYTFFDAEEWGLNLIYAGHYATETVGVKELTARLADLFGLEWDFFDHPTGL